jgi:hypothetical protein
MISKEQLRLTNNELEAQVIALQTQLECKAQELEGVERDLLDADTRISDLKDEIELTEHPPLVEVTCRRCGHKFMSLESVRYCNRDCEYFTPQSWQKPISATA